MSSLEAPTVQLTELGEALLKDRDGSLRISLRKTAEDLAAQSQALAQKMLPPNDFNRAKALCRALESAKKIIEQTRP